MRENDKLRAQLSKPNSEPLSSPSREGRDETKGETKAGSGFLFGRAAESPFCRARKGDSAEKGRDFIDLIIIIITDLPTGRQVSVPCIILSELSFLF